ncbi:unnamed protein product [Sympodiomycopsis kandeliae]
MSLTSTSTITIAVPTLIKATAASVTVLALVAAFFPFSGSKHEDSDSDSESECDLTDETREKMRGLKAGMFEECKLVLLVRTDLKMDKGKMAAQCSHATLACYKSLLNSNPQLVKHWETIGQAKVALKCPTEQEMNELEKKAKALGLCARSIRDAGRTQIAAGSKTVLGIGPGPVKLVDSVTGHLKLL